MSVNRWMDKEDVLYKCMQWNPTQPHRKEWNNAICRSTDATWDYHTNWVRGERRTSHDITYVWILKYDTNEPVCETEAGWVGVEHRLVAAGGERLSGEWRLGAQFRRSVVSDFATPWTTAHQASLSITNSRSAPKPMSVELVMPSNNIILCRLLLLLPSIFPSSRVFSIESALHMRWPKYWSFSFSISPSNEHSGLVSFRTDWLDLLAVQGTCRVFSSTTVQKH